MSSSSRRRIASNYMLRGGELHRNPVVEIDEGGEIISIESWGEGAMLDHSPSTEFYSGVMTAGFVNSHSHLELSYLRGAIPSGGGFASFASEIGRIRGGYSDEERRRAMVQADLDMRRGGVVAVGDICNGDTSFEIKSSSPIKYHNFVELFGLAQRDASSVEHLLRLAPDSSLTPHSLYSLNDEALRDVVERSGSSPLSIHFMESPGEDGLFRGEGHLHDWYERMGFECDFLHHGSIAQRLVALVPPDRSVMLIHNVCVEERDVELLLSHFTAPIYWVLCPLSNRYISDMRPPVELLMRRGLNICIGTDSLASNSSLSILDELRELRGFPLATRLDLATRQGARALGLDTHLGDIEVGLRPSLNIISGIDYTTMELTPESRVERVAE